MRIPLFNKQKKTPPPLDAEQQKPKHQKLDTLKAGRLAYLALQLTGKWVESFGGRIAGTASALSQAEAIAEEYKRFCDDVQQEDVELHEKAYGLPLKILVYLYPFVLVLLLIGSPLPALLALSLFSWYALRELWLYKSLVPNIGPAVNGLNVHASLLPKGEVKHTLVFTSHHDSARMYRYNRLDRFSYAKKVLLPVLLFALAFLSAFSQAIAELASGLLIVPNVPQIGSLVINLLLLCGIPFMFPLLSFFSEEGSPGAGDNLISCAITIQLARYFHWKRESGLPLSHTMLVFCSFDGEEIGLQGSRSFYSAHASDFIDPLVLNFDSIYHSDMLSFLSKDINGTQELSEKLAHTCVRVAQNMGFSAESCSIPRLAGGTDAAEASRHGLEACTLTSAGWDDRTKPAVYHSADDTVSAIEGKAVEHALSVAIRLAELVDSELIWQDEEAMIKEEPEVDPILNFSRISRK